MGGMTASSLFRVGVKLIGVYVIFGEAIPLTGQYGNMFLQQYSYASQGGMGMGMGVLEMLGWLIVPLIVWGGGLYLFFGGRKLADFALVRTQRYCPDCSFDLAGSVGERCPECGLVLPLSVLTVRDRLTLEKALEERDLAAAERRELGEPWKSIVARHEGGEG
ncbi:MAG: hypothetical protein ACTS3F_00180 [Phycisphaerales bacterium]